ncbi:C-type lectin Cal-like [Nerophis ophidion]|uniref:C-type lectin Cal-like n=1 Tax=Nerophis ophidion TaxID=159077 RepID=UPI002ADF8AAE|nr:C-type lectin Cal-like [Nerophis ophidion]
MAFSLSVFVLLCGISGVLTAGWSPSNLYDYAGCCPKGWTQFNDHCYSLKQPKTFKFAELVCSTLGGHLVSIHSYLENQVVRGLLDEADAKFAWIGLHDPSADGDYQWTDGSIVDFLKFPKRQPDHFGACVGIYAAGKWFVQDCENEEPYVCVRDAQCCGSH